MTYAVGYCRLSEKDSHSSSIASQKKRITEYCDRYKLKLLKIFVDDGKSGWTFDRPGFTELETFCKKNKQVRLLIIPHFDRFSRADPVDAMVKERYFRDKLNVKVLQISESPDTDTTNSTYQIVRFMQAFAANEERNRIVDRVKTAIHYKLLQGRYVSTAPYGYKNTRDSDGIATITLDPHKADIAKFILKQYLKGSSIEQIRTAATAKGFHVKGNSAIQKILVTPVYAGLVNVPAFKNMPAKLVRGVHQAIITESEYWQIQQLLSPKKFIAHKRDEVPLRGVIRCVHCGKLMTAAPSRSKLGRYYWYYFCTEHRKENYSAVKVHNHLAEILDALSIRGDYSVALKEKMSVMIQELINSKTKELMKVNLLIRNIEQVIATVEQKYLLENVSAESYTRVINTKRSELSELQAKKEVLNFGANDYYSRLEKFLQKASSVRTLYDDLNLVSKQHFVSQIFGPDLRYGSGSFRTPFIHPVFLMKPLPDLHLPLIILKNQVEKDKNSISVNFQGVHTNTSPDLLESVLAIFAA